MYVDAEIRRLADEHQSLLQAQRQVEERLQQLTGAENVMREPAHEQLEAALLAQAVLIQTALEKNETASRGLEVIRAGLEKLGLHDRDLNSSAYLGERPAPDAGLADQQRDAEIAAEERGKALKTPFGEIEKAQSVTVKITDGMKDFIDHAPTPDPIATTLFALGAAAEVIKEVADGWEPLRKLEEGITKLQAKQIDEMVEKYAPVPTKEQDDANRLLGAKEEDIQKVGAEEKNLFEKRQQDLAAQAELIKQKLLQEQQERERIRALYDRDSRG